jgi:hypothetical protein
MENKLLCQSCTIPLDNGDTKGTEKDGSKSNEYCKYCYVNGELVNPNMTLDEMKDMVKTQMGKMNLPANLIELSLKTLPGLKRWKNKIPTAL